MQNKNILIGVVVALLLVLGVGGYAYYQSAMAPQNQEVVMEETNNMDMTMDEMDMTIDEETAMESTEAAMPQNGEIIVEGSNFKYAPNNIVVKAGEKVRLVFKNTQGMHDFVVDELGIKTEVIQQGQQEVVEFTADKAGTYEFYCSVGQHRQMGMVGTLTVQ